LKQLIVTADDFGRSVAANEAVEEAFKDGILRGRLRRAGVVGNDRVYGIRDSGSLVRERMLSLLAELPDGVTEIFSHPARGGWDGVEEAARHYRFEEEFYALVDTDVKAAAASSGATLTAFRGI